MQKQILFIFIIATSLWSCMAQAIEDVSENATPTFHMTGSLALLSQYIEHGLSQTNKAPSLQGSFWFNFGPQLKIGLWGSNVNYVNEDAHIVLKPSAEVKINFTTNTSVTISYSDNEYYNSTYRNGNTIGLHLRSTSYRVNYEIASNWENTQTSATYYSLGKTFDVFTRWKWDNEVGYTMVKADNYSNYLDFRTFLGTKLSQVFVEGGITGTPTTSQFSSNGGYFFVVKASAEF